MIMSITRCFAMAVMPLAMAAGCNPREDPGPAPAASAAITAPRSMSFDALAKALRSEPLRNELAAAAPGWSMNIDNTAYLDGSLNGTPTCLQEAIWRLDVSMTQPDFEAHLPKVFAALEASVRKTVTDAGGEMPHPGELTRNAAGKLELLLRYTHGPKIGWVQVAQKQDQWSHLWLNLTEEPR